VKDLGGEAPQPLGPSMELHHIVARQVDGLRCGRPPDGVATGDVEEGENDRPGVEVQATGGDAPAADAEEGLVKAPGPAQVPGPDQDAEDPRGFGRRHAQREAPPVLAVGAVPNPRRVLKPRPSLRNLAGRPLARRTVANRADGLPPATEDSSCRAAPSGDRLTGMRPPSRLNPSAFARLAVPSLPILLLASVAFPASALAAPAAAGAADALASLTVSGAGTPGSPAGALAAPVTTGAPVGDGGAVPFATSPHPGTIEDWEDEPGGSVTEDPSLAYDSVSFEPILNVYETLVNYNGSSTSTFVPTLATCVPGTVQCGEDYPTEAANTQDLITYDPATGVPMYFTFVIDQNARFYDPLTKVSWNVYPSDVVFSIDRTMAFADQPYEGRYNGWMLSQALLNWGNPYWDIVDGEATGLHYPYNNTPYNELSAIRVNDSTYCPASAMSEGHGCVTFNATGFHSDWPFFLELVADGLGASVEPCGVFTYDGAGLPGWAGTGATDGDGPCLLPGGATSTDDTSFQNFLADPATGGNATYWDPVEELAITQSYPAVQPGVQWTMTGSGPYFAYSDSDPSEPSINVGLNYSLHQSPAYAQPAGCAGLDGYAAYPDSSCDPAPDAYPATINTYWEANPAQYQEGLAELEAGQADFATILPSDWPEAVSLSHSSALPCSETGSSCGPPWYHSNRVDITVSPTLANLELSENLDVNLTAFALDFPAAEQPALPSVMVGTSLHSYFFSGSAVRGFLSAAYPYAAIEQTVWSADALPSQLNAGGPLPEGLGPYYPSNFTFPYQSNGGVPSDNPSQTGSAAWWFVEGTTNPSPSNPYYDPLLASCLNTTCTFPIEGEPGLTTEDDAIHAFVLAIEQLSEPNGCSSTSCAALQPYLYDPPFDCPADGCGASSAGYQALWYGGWAADYPDPSDILGAYGNPAGAFPDQNSLQSVLDQMQFQSPACRHVGDSLANLTYWADSGPVPQGCQFVAYNESLYWQSVAFSLPVGPARTSAYQLVDEVISNLDLYVWEGQPLSYQFSAPWIAGGSITANPFYGWYEDRIFYQLHYAAPLTVREAGLSPHASWGIDLGGIDHNTTSAVEVVGASTGLSPSNDWSPIAPAGYALAHTTPLGENPAALDVPPNGLSITLDFARTSAVTISESGLPVGTNWSVTVTPPLDWEFTVAESAYEVVTSSGPNQVTFPTLVAGPWEYKVSSNPTSALSGFKTVPLAVLSGPRGAPLDVPNTGAPVSRSLTFSLATAAITFTEGGLPVASHPNWSVTISGTEADGQAYGPTTVSAAAPAPIHFELPQGTYTYSFGSVTVGATTYTATGGSIALSNLHPWLPPSPLRSTPHYPVHATYADPPAGGASAAFTDRAARWS
jgi:hypothetical protein